MTQPRSIFSFTLNAFNTVELRLKSPDNQSPDKVAALLLMSKLKEAGIAIKAELEQEDFGCYFDFAVDGKWHTVIVGFRPAESGISLKWVGWIERKRGLILSIAGRRNKVSRNAANCIHAALRSSGEVDELSWYSRSNFDLDHEELGAAEP